jgi:NAD(P)-dependent dehydrogenase (short-subunit alcohol dehydrogenase family)
MARNAARFSLSQVPRGLLMNVYDVKDRVAIVTGAAQGIGLAVTNRILASGGKVAIWDRDKELLGKTVVALGVPDRIHGLSVEIADRATHRARRNRRPVRAVARRPRRQSAEQPRIRAGQSEGACRRSPTAIGF